MIKISHALAVTLLGLVLITGYFNNMLDGMRTEIFALENKLQEEIETPTDGSYDNSKGHYYKLKQ